MDESIQEVDYSINSRNVVLESIASYVRTKEAFIRSMLYHENHTKNALIASLSVHDSSEDGGIPLLEEDEELFTLEEDEELPPLEYICENDPLTEQGD